MEDREGDWQHRSRKQSKNWIGNAGQGVENSRRSGREHKEGSTKQSSRPGRGWGAEHLSGRVQG